MSENIESKIKLNVIFIYILVALICGGIIFYFYSGTKKINTKKKTIEEYNNELVQINELIYLVNEAQAEVNLFVITEKRKHLRNYKDLAGEINLRIDSLDFGRDDLGIDSILTEISDLLKRKEQSILLLNKQFSTTNPMDSLSRKLTSYSTSTDKENNDSIITFSNEPLKEQSKKNLWKKFTDIFSSNNNEEFGDVGRIPIGADSVPGEDTLYMNQVIEEAKQNYNQHITAIENRFNSVVLADQYINARITELLTMLYNQIIQARMDELSEDELLLQRNHTRVMIFGAVALIAILISIILILQNVNKGYVARKELEDANERTRQLMESRHRLLLSVSHDVKTPLNSILGYIELYEKEEKLEKEEVAPINIAGNHILTLLSNLLEFSSLEKGSVTLVPGNFSLRELCSDICEMFKSLAQKKSLGFNCYSDFEPELYLFSDCLKIKQILTNILSNAIKYTEEGEITFKIAYKEGVLEFDVTDTGVGVAPDMKEKLFKPFSRLKNTGMLEEGSGFGLFVVKGLVELFKGEINFYSEQGKGTQIIIKLPVPESESRIDEFELKKILLVDDDEVFLDILSRLCKKLGHEVILCRNKYEFTERLSMTDTFNCVLTDMEMTDFTGVDVLKEVKSIDSDIPVILITGRSSQTLTDILSEGFTDYLPKPVSISALQALIGGRINDKQGGEDLIGLLGQDWDALVEIMDNFFMSTVNNVILIRNATGKKDFNQVQSVCHKMLPMFLQTNAPSEITDILKHIDNLRDKGEPESELWEQVELLPGLIESFLEEIQQNYLSD